MGHGDGESDAASEPEQEAVSAGINLDESPLAWLARRRDRAGEPLISADEFRAGERLRRDYTSAHLAPRVTSNWSGLSGTGGRRGAPGHGIDLSDQVIAARQRVNAALEAVGPDLAGVVIDVCCYLKGLEDAERISGWPRRSGKIMLRIALRSLARHYGITARRDQHRWSRITSWGSADFRPAIGGDRSQAD